MSSTPLFSFLLSMLSTKTKPYEVFRNALDHCLYLNLRLTVRHRVKPGRCQHFGLYTNTHQKDITVSAKKLRKNRLCTAVLSHYGELHNTQPPPPPPPPWGRLVWLGMAWEGGLPGLLTLGFLSD